MSERIAYLDISHDLLVELLKLPYGSSVKRIESSPFPDAFRLLVSSLDLEPVGDNETPPQVLLEAEKITTRYVSCG